MAFNPFTTLAKKGGYGKGVKDTRLAHINPAEDALLRAHGGEGSINPRTGLPQYKGGGGGGAAAGRGADGRGGAGTGAGSDKGGKGSDREDKSLASQLDKSRNLPGSQVGGTASNPKGGNPSLGRQISDLFGGPTAFANNPYGPNYDTDTMGLPINMSWSDVLNAPINSPLDAFTKFAGMVASPIGYGMMATRAMQAATGMSGGPSIGGRDDAKGAFGGHGGTANGGMDGGALRPDKLGLPGGTPSQVQEQVAAPPPQSQVDQLKKRQYALGLNGIPSPFGYTYGTARWL